MAQIGIRELLEAGVHFGHQTRRWNPKMRRFIFGERDGNYIIDLLQTQVLLEDARQFASDVSRRGGTVLFVGTKKQARDTIRENAEAADMPYVNHRWLGGLLTNFQTISLRIKRLHDLERYETEGQLQLLPTRERMAAQADLEKLRANLGGVKNMQRLPDAVFVIDLKTEAIAVREAQRLRIPIIGLVDTNCDPDGIDYVVPGNDDAIRSCALITRAIGDVVSQGHNVFREEEERARLERERQEAEERARQEAEERARQEAEEQARLERERQEAEQRSVRRPKSGRGRKQQPRRPRKPLRRPQRPRHSRPRRPRRSRRGGPAAPQPRAAPAAPAGRSPGGRRPRRRRRQSEAPAAPVTEAPARVSETPAAPVSEAPAAVRRLRRPRSPRRPSQSRPRSPSRGRSAAASPKRPRPRPRPPRSRPRSPRRRPPPSPSRPEPPAEPEAAAAGARAGGARGPPPRRGAAGRRARDRASRPRSPRPRPTEQHPEPTAEENS